MLKTFQYIYEVLKLAWKATGIYIVLSIISQIYEGTIYPFIQIFLLAKLLDLIGSATHKLTFNDISWMIVFYLLASLIRIILRMYMNTKDAMTDVKLGNYGELLINEKLSQLDPATLENTDFQNLLSQMDGIRMNMKNIIMRITYLFDSIFKTITAIIVVSTAFPIFIPIILISTLPSYFALNKYRDSVLPFMTEETGKLGRITRYITNLLSNDSTSKEAAIFKNGSILTTKLKNTQDKYAKGYAKAIDSTMWQLALADMFQFAAFVYTQALNLLAVFAGKFAVGQFTLYFQQTLNLSIGLGGILDQYSGIYTRTKYVEKWLEFLNYPRAINSKENPEILPQEQIPPLIEFKDISFKYPGTDRFILEKFNLSLKPGEKIALVGENGAGKTTLIKLLLRFYDVTEGEILLNGVNVKEIDLNEWHKMVGALFQDFIKYQFSFKENVIFGDLSKKDDLEALKEAINKSGADSYMGDLPDGLNQTLGKMFEHGVDLSGGQWQKLALARAFFRDAPVLILDEPTAAIDAKAEYEIFERVQKLQKDKTVIIISHRFSTVRNADRILVLDEGRIIEEGNHRELMKQNGLYAELFNIQAQGYK